MPVTINGSVLTQNDPTGATPSTLTFTSTVLTAGDIVLLIVNQNSPNNPPTAGTPTGGTGLSWSTAADQANTATHNSRTTAFWTKVPSDQTSTITVDTTAGGNNVGTDGILYRLSGVDQVSPIGLTDGFQGQTDPTGTDLQLSGTKAGSMIFMAASDWSAGTASLMISISNTTGGTTDRSNLESAEYRSIAFHANQSGSTNQGTLDYSAATGDWAAVIFEVEAAPAAGGLLFRPGKTWRRRYKHPQRLYPGIISAVDIRNDTALATVGLEADVTAKKIAVVTAVSSLGLASTVTAKKITPAVAVGAVGLAANAVHVDVRAVTALVTVGLTSTNTAKKVTPTTSVATVGLTGTTTAKKVTPATLRSTVGLAGIVTAKKVGKATGLGTVGLQASFAHVEIHPITALATLGATAYLTGKKRSTPLAAGVVGLTGNVLPKKISKSTGTGVLPLTGQAIAFKRLIVIARSPLGLAAWFDLVPPVFDANGRVVVNQTTVSTVGASSAASGQVGITQIVVSTVSGSSAASGRTSVDPTVDGRADVG